MLDFENQIAKMLNLFFPKQYEARYGRKHRIFESIEEAPIVRRRNGEHGLMLS